MIRAGILANTSGGYVAVVVAERLEKTWRVISAKSLEVGQRVNLVEPTKDARGRHIDMTRSISSADIASITSIVVSMTGRADEVRIATIANPVTEAIQLRFPGATMLREAGRRAVVDVSSAFPGWSPLEEGRNLIIRAAELVTRAIGDEILDAELVEAAAETTAATEPKPRSVIDDLAAARERARKLSSGTLEKLAPMMHATSDYVTSPDTGITAQVWPPKARQKLETAEQAIERISNETPVPQCLLNQNVTRLAGIDPGSKHLGLIITDGATLPLKLHLAKTIEIGGKEQLKKPIIRKRKDGSEFSIESKNTFDDETIDMQVTLLIADLLENNVRRIILERVFSAFSRQGASKSFEAAEKTELLKSMWLTALIRERARRAGIEVTMVSRTSWISKVAGRPKGKGRGGEQVAMLGPALKRHIEGWPEVSNPHTRDAGGLVVWARMFEREQIEKTQRAADRAAKKRPVRVKKPRPPRTSPTPDEIKAKRAETGCTCEGKGKHRGKCPLAKKPQWFIELEARNATV